MTLDEAQELVTIACELDPRCAEHMAITRQMLGLDDGQGEELLRWEMTPERLALLRFRSEELAEMAERWSRSMGQA